MKIPTTIRTLLLPELVIISLLFVAATQFPSRPEGMAMEPGGSPHSKSLQLNVEIPRPKGKVLYVSPEGNDAWSGKRAEPNPARTDGPFATLVRARDAIRSKQ